MTVGNIHCDMPALERGTRVHQEIEAELDITMFHESIKLVNHNALKPGDIVKLTWEGNPCYGVVFDPRSTYKYVSVAYSYDKYGENSGSVWNWNWLGSKTHVFHELIGTSAKMAELHGVKVASKFVGLIFSALKARDESNKVSSFPVLHSAVMTRCEKGDVYIAQRASWKHEAYMIIRYSMGSFYHANAGRVSASRSELSIHKLGTTDLNNEIEAWENKFRAMYPDKKLYT